MRRDGAERIKQLSQPPEGKTPLQFPSRYPQSYLSQYRIVTHRHFVSYFRNTSYNCTRFVFGIVLGLLFGSTLWNVGHKRCCSVKSFVSSRTFPLEASMTSLLNPKCCPVHVYSELRHSR